MEIEVMVIWKNRDYQKKKRQMRMKSVNQQDSRHLHPQECASSQIALGCSAIIFASQMVDARWAAGVAARGAEPQGTPQAKNQAKRFLIGISTTFYSSIKL